MCRSGGSGGSIVYRSGGSGLYRSGRYYVLGGVFVEEVVEGVEQVVGCVVRLVLWCANGRGYFCVVLA